MSTAQENLNPPRNQQWSTDFVHYQMLDGRAIRVLALIDQWSRESVSLEANFRP